MHTRVWLKVSGSYSIYADTNPPPPQGCPVHILHQLYHNLLYTSTHHSTTQLKPPPYPLHVILLYQLNGGIVLYVSLSYEEHHYCTLSKIATKLCRTLLSRLQPTNRCFHCAKEDCYKHLVVGNLEDHKMQNTAVFTIYLYLQHYKKSVISCILPSAPFCQVSVARMSLALHLVIISISAAWMSTVVTAIVSFNDWCQFDGCP